MGHKIEISKKKKEKKFISDLNDQAAARFINVVDEMLKNYLADQVRKCKYISVLIDDSTDTAVIEEEMVYLLFMTEQRKLKVKILCIESPEFITAEGLKEGIKIALIG